MISMIWRNWRNSRKRVEWVEWEEEGKEDPDPSSTMSNACICPHGGMGMGIGSEQGSVRGEQRMMVTGNGDGEGDGKGKKVTRAEIPPFFSILWWGKKGGRWARGGWGLSNTPFPAHGIDLPMVMGGISSPHGKRTRGKRMTADCGG